MNLGALPFTMLLIASVAGAAAAVNEGDTEQQVRQEKGAPTGTMRAGDLLLLRYPDEVIKLRAGRVISIETARLPRTVSVAPSATPVPAARPVAPLQPKLEPPPAEAGWMTDYRGALAQARQQQRYVFLFFTGSDWCIWCRKLHGEVLATGEFAQYAREKLVPVEIDFPKSKPQSAQLKAQNVALAREFKIRGYPTVVVLDPEGKPVGQLGYQRGGPEPFLRRLRALLPPS